MMDIYIKPKKKATLAGRREILISDVADVVATDKVAASVKNLRLQKIETDGEQKKTYVISITDIIRVVTNHHPNCTVVNVGEMDTLVQHAVGKSHDRRWLKWLKVAFVALVLMIGSATAIMSFHTDGQIPKIFERYYQMFYGHEMSNPRIINIPYSIGLAVGILVFYNHFLGRKLTDDPTPIDVEVELYDNDITEALVDMISRKNEANHDND
ncbi:MAG: stage V sporulation protein AA [Defluviitaleaceae bacterium]|nr:stage V sporulation protein AA [Defluviitaleaceae bacterium]